MLFWLGVRNVGYRLVEIAERRLDRRAYILQVEDRWQQIDWRLVIAWRDRTRSIQKIPDVSAPLPSATDPSLTGSERQ